MLHKDMAGTMAKIIDESCHLHTIKLLALWEHNFVRQFMHMFNMRP